MTSHWGIMHNKRHTSTFFGPLLPIQATILCHQRAFRAVIYPRLLGNGGEAKAVISTTGPGVWWRYDEGHVFG